VFRIRVIGRGILQPLLTRVALGLAVRFRVRHFPSQPQAPLLATNSTIVTSTLAASPVRPQLPMNPGAAHKPAAQVPTRPRRAKSPRNLQVGTSGIRLWIGDVAMVQPAQRTTPSEHETLSSLRRRVNQPPYSPSGFIH
jgi:hypothetical protein